MTSKRPAIAYTDFESHLGTIFVASEDGALTDLAIASTEEEFVTRLTERPGRYSAPVRAPEGFSSLFKSLERYFSAKPVDFDQPVLLYGTRFEKLVWEGLRSVPWGFVRSYKQVAALVGSPRATRAVGRACGANPIPIVIPCHRVLRSDGGIGGYSGGLDIKRTLLNIEGIF